MIILLLNTGIRRGELLSLTWENVNLSLATLTAIGRTAKSEKHDTYQLIQKLYILCKPGKINATTRTI